MIIRISIILLFLSATIINVSAQTMNDIYTAESAPPVATGLPPHAFRIRAAHLPVKRTENVLKNSGGTYEINSADECIFFGVSNCDMRHAHIGFLAASDEAFVSTATETTKNDSARNAVTSDGLNQAGTTVKEISETRDDSFELSGKWKSKKLTKTALNSDNSAPLALEGANIHPNFCRIFAK